MLVKKGKMVSTSNISNSFRNGARKFITQMTNPDALAPIILLEAAVTGGRTYQAYKRGGFVEARERGTEETLGAIFWLGGVSAFNKLGNMVGKKIFKVEDIDFDAAKDAVRNPFKNFVRETKLTEGKLTAFKFGRTITSILLANAIIGFIVPKINQRITRHYQDAIKKAKEKNPIENKTGKTPAFKGGIQRLLSLSDKFEHDAKYKLLATDVGIAGGRAVNARNKHERTEILVRDVGSIYFYMFCKNHINSALNYLETKGSRTQRLDPVSAKQINRAIRLTQIKNPKVKNVEEFKKLIFGDTSISIPDKLKFQSNEKSSIQIIKLSEFKEFVGKSSMLAKKAERMSRLQPKLDGIAILTKEQVLDIYQGGLINSPELLNKVFSTFTEGKSTNETSFVHEKDLRALKGRMVDYIEDIIKEAEKSGSKVTDEVLKKVNTRNILRNGLNLGLGLGISAYFLSTVIPKVQYWITQKHTGKNNFPGVEKYEK